MQRYTVFFITVSALHVTGSFSAHHQELKNCTYSVWYMSSLLAATASGIRNSKTVHTASGICQACLLLPLAVSGAQKMYTQYLVYVKLACCYR